MSLLETVLRAHPETILATVALVVGLLGAAWNGHTDRSRAVANCIKSAIASLGWTHAHAASIAGMSREEFDHALAGRKALSIHRLAALPDEFWAEFDRRRVSLRGGVIVESTDLVFVIRPAMAKMTLPAKVSHEHAS